MQGMETITNKEVNVRLDNEKGTLCLTGLLAGTMVFLYDSQEVDRSKAITVDAGGDGLVFRN